MNALLEKYSNKGLVILGFPCNQFGHQENCKNEEILNSLKHVRPGGGFVPQLELFSKVEVNGEKTHPLFSFLKKKLPRPHGDEEDVLMANSKLILWNPVLRSDVKWNFEKFLVDSKGDPFRRYGPKFQTTDISPDIEALLAEK